jgi:hypothetical protein
MDLVNDDPAALRVSLKRCCEELRRFGKTPMCAEYLIEVPAGAGDVRIWWEEQNHDRTPINGNRVSGSTRRRL